MTVQPGHAANATDDLREAFFRHAHRLLGEVGDCGAEWLAAREFLRDYGFDVQRLEGLPIGFFPDVRELREPLLRQGFTAAEVRGSTLLADRRLAGRLVGPIRNAQGRIVSFWARCPHPGTVPFGPRVDTEIETGPHPQGPACLYLNHEWKHASGLFGLDVAMGAAAECTHDLLVVEDVLDAILLHVNGVPHVAAIGGAATDLDECRLARLAELGIHRLTLVPSGGEPFAPGLMSALETAMEAPAGPAVFLLPPEKVPSGVRPGQWLRSMGKEAMDDLLARERIHGLHYRAMQVAARHKPGSTWTDDARRAAIAEARRLYETVHPRVLPQLDVFFVPALLDQLGLAWDAWPGRREAEWSEQPTGETKPCQTEEAPDERDGSSVEESSQVEGSRPVEPPASGTGETNTVVHRKGTVPFSSNENWDSPPPASPPAPPRHTGRSRWCEVHGCDSVECFCWD